MNCNCNKFDCISMVHMPVKVDSSKVTHITLFNKSPKLYLGQCNSYNILQVSHQWLIYCQNLMVVWKYIIIVSIFYCLRKSGCYVMQRLKKPLELIFARCSMWVNMLERGYSFQVIPGLALKCHFPLPLPYYCFSKKSKDKTNCFCQLKPSS